MQYVCLSSKMTSSVALANHVPLIKKSLETFVYRAKAMLAANDCPEAFVLGTLVNRDLDGGQLKLSQATDDGEEEEEDDDDEEGEEEEEEVENEEGEVQEEDGSRNGEEGEYTHISEVY